MGEAAVPSAHLPPLSRVEAGSGLQGEGEPRGGVRFLRPRAPPIQGSLRKINLGVAFWAATAGLRASRSTGR